MSVNMNICMHIFIYKCRTARMYICMYKCIYKLMHDGMHAYKCTYIYAYIQHIFPLHKYRDFNLVNLIFIAFISTN